jgi:hypothetical protein
LLTRRGTTPFEDLMRHFIFFALCLSAGCAGAPPASDPAAASPLGDKGDSAWCHLNFDSVEGTNIRVDYQLVEKASASEVSWTASPVWLNVSASRFDGSEHPRVWIGDSGYVNKEGYALAKQFHALTPFPDTQLDLAASEDRHRATGQVAGELRVSDYAVGDDEVEVHAHEFAVVIDGEWQTDPVSGSHNFLTTNLYACGQ